MSIVIAAIYGLASLWLPILAMMWITAGLAYGVGVFVVVTYVVVRFQPRPVVHRLGFQRSPRTWWQCSVLD
jgi:hypothetical protein